MASSLGGSICFPSKLLEKNRTRCAGNGLKGYSAGVETVIIDRMTPLVEKLTIPFGSSWAMLDRKVETGIPFQWHQHPEYELTLTLNSRGQRYVGDTVEPYEDGDLVLLGPNLPHTWCSSQKVDPSRCYVTKVMWFKHEWVETLLSVLVELRPVVSLLSSAGRGVVFSRRMSEEIRPRIEEMPELEPVKRLASFLEVLALLAREKQPRCLTGPGGVSKITTPDQERIDRVFEYIHTKYQSEISINDLADLACLSLSGFHRFFYRHTLSTVTQYLANLRIGQACSLLISTSLPIASISDFVGFGNLAHFHRRFKELRSMTPREFRKNFC
jgi:AraC-like DNA-binding protein/quercetin dioxygenase-like cupin family protein